MEIKYQFLINKREGTSLKDLNDSKAFIDYLNDINDNYKTIEKYKPNKKRKLLILFDDMVIDTLGNEKLNSTVTELIIGGRKLNISLAFITQSYFFVPNNNIRLEMKNLQYNINNINIKISALSSEKIDKCKYLTGEEILPFNQRTNNRAS